ncbi:MAG: hypothetical protein GY937_13555 [bacterium]|nr:hypothetical protein [bacterium]
MSVYSPWDGLLEAALRLKEQGKVRHLMMSTHNRPLLPSMFEEYEKRESPFDAFMFRYNAVHRGGEKDVFPFLPGGPKPGILTYTTTRWGHLLDPKKMPPGETPPPASDCYRFALSNENVDVALCGPADEAQMDEALRALERGPLKPDERERIERIGDFIYGRYKPTYAEGGD